MDGRFARSFQAAAVATVLAAGMSGRAVAADQLDTEMNEAGKVWYEQYCSPCHGAGGAPGTAVAKATQKPVDLRTYVNRHGGKFPVADWIAVTQEVNPGGTHVPVWNAIKRQQTGPAPEAAARGILASIARYVRSIQTK